MKKLDCTYRINKKPSNSNASKSNSKKKRKNNKNNKLPSFPQLTSPKPKKDQLLISKFRTTGRE